MGSLKTKNRGAERLMALAPLGFLFALMLGNNGQLARVPLLIGTVGWLIGLALHLFHRKTAVVFARKEQ